MKRIDWDKAWDATSVICVLALSLGALSLMVMLVIAFASGRV